MQTIYRCPNISGDFAVRSGVDAPDGMHGSIVYHSRGAGTAAVTTQNGSFQSVIIKLNGFNSCYLYKEKPIVQPLSLRSLIVVRTSLDRLLQDTLYPYFRTIQKMFRGQ